MTDREARGAPTQANRTAPDPVKGPPADIRRSTWWWIRAAAILVTIFVAVQLLGMVQSVLGALLTVVLYVLFGSVIAFIAGPIVQMVEDRLHPPRTAAILLTLLVGIGVIAGIGYLIATPIVDEASQLSKQGPALIKQFNDVATTVRTQLASHGIQLSGNGVGTTISSDVSSRVAGVLLNVVGSTVTILLDILVTLVVAFWMIKDGEQLRGGIVNLLPGRVRSEANFAFDAFGVVVGGYVRGQLLMAAIVGVMAGLGCWVIGVPFPIVVAIAAGAFELIPLVGAFVGGAVAILLALTKSPVTAVWAGLLFIAIHMVEGYLLAPRIQARFVRLHPLVTILALFAGIELGGFLGAFVAVPLASLTAVFVRAGMGDAKSSHPEVFTEQRRDVRVERRRRHILGEFRLVRRPPPPTGAKSDIDTVP
ncbi:MAG TPA: AI-2E family transporter [Candidatus Dormibacteraeota bacterium]|nr:AI-2E family transporter [Candidatus Dormibacteraeota bacterium]